MGPHNSCRRAAISNCSNVPDSRLLEQADRHQTAFSRMPPDAAPRGWPTARNFEKLEGNTAFETHQRYLETVINLGERQAMSRTIYLAEVGTL